MRKLSVGRRSFRDDRSAVMQVKPAAQRGRIGDDDEVQDSFEIVLTLMAPERVTNVALCAVTLGAPFVLHRNGSDVQPLILPLEVTW
jgi:hypothetical protein